MADPTRRDRLVPFDPIPEVWQRNLSALGAVDAALHDLILSANFPSTARPALGLDDSPTYRLEAGGEGPVWLGDSSIPRGRAEEVWARAGVERGNIALPTCDDGALVALALARLPRESAVFVFAERAWHVAAALKLHDVSSAIAGGRCYLLLGDDPEAALRAVFGAHTGLLPPTQIVHPFHVEAARLGRIEAACGEVGRDVMVAREQALAAVPAARGGAGKFRFAVCGMRGGSGAGRLARAVGRAAESLGWEVCVAVADDPRRADPRLHAAALLRHGADLTVFVGHEASLLPRAAELGVLGCWRLDMSGARPGDMLELAATPAIHERLREAPGFDECKIYPLYYGADDGETNEVLLERGCDEVSAGALLVGDLPDISAAALELELHTHRTLLAALVRGCEDAWAADRVLNPHVLIASASERLGLVFDLGTREAAAWLRLVTASVWPHVVRRRVAEVLYAAGFAVHVAGRGWDEVARVRVVAPDAWEMLANVCDYSAAVLVEPGDPLHPCLFEILARGVPTLAYGEVSALAAGCGVESSAVRFVQSFRGPTELGTLAGALATVAGVGVADRAAIRRAVLATDGYRRRLSALREALSEQKTPIIRHAGDA